MTTWDRCKPFLSYIKAAVQAGLPPKQVIFADPEHTEYDFWDLRLIAAYHFAEAFVHEGVPMWWDESPDVAWTVEKRVSRSRAAISRAEKSETGKDKEPPPGRYYLPEPHGIGGKSLPSFDEWQKQQESLKGRK